MWQGTLYKHKSGQGAWRKQQQDIMEAKRPVQAQMQLSRCNASMAAMSAVYARMASVRTAGTIMRVSSPPSCCVRRGGAWKHSRSMAACAGASWHPSMVMTITCSKSRQRELQVGGRHAGVSTQQALCVACTAGQAAALGSTRLSAW